MNLCLSFLLLCLLSTSLAWASEDAELVALQEENARLVQEKQSLLEQMLAWESQSADALTRLQARGDELEELRLKLNQVAESLSAERAQLIENKNNNSKKISGINRFFNQALSWVGLNEDDDEQKFSEHLRAYNADLENYNAQLAAYTADLDSYQLAQDNLTPDAQGSASLRPQIEGLDVSIAAVELKIAAREQAIKSEQAEAARQDDLFNALPSEQKISALQERIAQRKQELARLQGEINDKYDSVNGLYQSITSDSSQELRDRYASELANFNQLKDSWSELRLQQGSDQAALTAAMDAKKLEDMQNVFNQLTSKRLATEGRSLPAKMGYNLSVPVDPESCAEKDRLSETFVALEVGTREFNQIRHQLEKISRPCLVKVYIDPPHQSIYGFALRNTGSPRINPQGTGNDEGGYREYSFEFTNKANMKLSLVDDAKLEHLDSHDHMETAMVFIPRLVEPYLELTDKGQVVHLPTGETVTFDAETKEILNGVLSEQAIDLSMNRSTRNFARVNYQGKGLIIQTDRRGNSPEYTFRDSYNTHEQLKHARVKYNGKECLVLKTLLWDGTLGDDGVSFKYASDEELLDKVINPVCKWNLSLSDLTP